MAVQSADELDDWYSTEDPWGYESNEEDAQRKRVLLSELPKRPYQRVLDIGCGNGFITRELPGDQVIGMDISGKAIKFARKHASARTQFVVGSVFSMSETVSGPFDLIVITGVLYPQYVGNALSVVYQNLMERLAPEGILASVHIDDWSRARFPLLRLSEHFYPYREHTHRLEIYVR